MFNNIRVAEGRDTPFLMQLIKDAHSKSPYYNSSFDNLLVLNLIDELINCNKILGIIIVATDDLDHPIGLIMAKSSTAIFNRDLIAQEILWWVSPDYRRSHSGIALYKAFTHWAKQINAKVLIMSTTDQRLDKFYKRQGYDTQEIMYIKGI